jgi:hypothetical protein
MDEFIATAAFYGTALLYPIVTGPLAAYVLLLVLRRHDRRLIVLFWPVLTVLHAAGYLLMMRTLGDFLPGPGSLACLVTPVFAVATALGMRLASRRLRQAPGRDPVRQRWLVAGTFLIPLMQLVTVATLLLLAPTR